MHKTTSPSINVGIIDLPYIFNTGNINVANKIDIAITIIKIPIVLFKIFLYLSLYCSYFNSISNSFNVSILKSLAFFSLFIILFFPFNNHTLLLTARYCIIFIKKF